jgi:hypothetical protein
LARQALLATLFLVVGCFAPNFGQGLVRCGDDGSCPPGYGCGGDRLCYSAARLADGGADLAVADLAVASGADLTTAAGADLLGQPTPDLATIASTPDLSCKPTVKCGFQQCGTLPDDGCGNVLHCGDCAIANTCSAQTANSCTCTPAKSCSEFNGIHCGQYPDGCGGVLNCPACGVSQLCGYATDPYTCGNQSICTPVKCQPGQCGDIADGCSTVLHCGGCPTGQICGAVGQHNRCG